MLDLNNFIKLAPPPSDSLFYIKVTDLNHIMLSHRLMDKIPFRNLDIYCSNDGRIIAVKSSANGILKANVNGYIRTDVISELMKRHGIKTPARFVAEWIEADKIWLCTYCGDYYKQRNIENTPMPKTIKKKELCRNGSLNKEENAFFNKNYPFICEYCKNTKASLEYEDKLSACMEGFLYSARTYRKRMGKFRVYAEKCMSEHIEKTRRTLAKQKQCEMYNFSLDKKISSDDNKTTYADFICADYYDCFSSADLNQMISKLDKSCQQICKLFYIGYKEKEICEMLGIDTTMLRKCKAEIRNVLSEFAIA